MEGRFFGIPRSSRQPAYYYSVPARPQQPARSPKVVSIPVHFVDPEPTRVRTRSRVELAIRIQAVFRGFVVRKYVKELDVVRREVEEIERRVRETAELMRRDERERLKVNEALMSLLFRLDSVRGVDAGVRDLRKRVIRKAIQLQEKVDGFAAADLAGHKDGRAAEVEKREEVGIDLPDLPDRDRDDAEADKIDKQVADLLVQGEGGCVNSRCEEPAHSPHQKMGGCDKAEQEEGRMSDAFDLKEGRHEAEQSGDLDVDLPEDNRAKLIEDSDHVADKVNDTCDLIMQMEPSHLESSGESISDPSLNPESFLEEVDENAPMKEEDEIEQEKLTEEKEWEAAADRNEAMLGRMMEDNEKMMTLMMQLFERNERQIQLLSLLSQRVERLEKAFLCEKLRRKKKKTDGDRLPNTNKCGKKL